MLLKMFASSIHDIHGSVKQNTKKTDMDKFLPFIILPLSLLTAAISGIFTIIVMVVIVMAALYVQSRPRQNNRSPFFLSWTLSSGIYMFTIFELGIVSLLEITQLENFIFLLLVACTCYFFYKMKNIADTEFATESSKGIQYSPVLTSDSYYCQICQIEVNDRFFHSIWLNCCVLKPNYPYYVAGQLFAFFTLLFGTNLGLTTICQPYKFYGPFLLPGNCMGVYDNIEVAYNFVTCVYGLGYLIVLALVLLQQFFIYIPKYSAPQWRKLGKILNISN